MTLLIILLTVSVILNAILFVAGYRKVLQIEKITKLAQEYAFKLDAVNIRMQDTLEEMRAIDIRGAFEADDEVGAAFKSLESLIEQVTEENVSEA